MTLASFRPHAALSPVDRVQGVGGSSICYVLFFYIALTGCAISGHDPSPAEEPYIITSGNHKPSIKQSLSSHQKDKPLHVIIWSSEPAVVSHLTEGFLNLGIIVVERAALERVFDEQRIRLAHASDTDIFRVGGLLGADKIVFVETTARPVGSGYILTVTIRGVDVQSGEVEFSGTATGREPAFDREFSLGALATWAVDRAACRTEDHYVWVEPTRNPNKSSGCIPISARER